MERLDFYNKKDRELIIEKFVFYFKYDAVQIDDPQYILKSKGSLVDGFYCIGQ